MSCTTKEYCTGEVPTRVSPTTLAEPLIDGVGGALHGACEVKHISLLPGAGAHPETPSWRCPPASVKNTQVEFSD